MRDIPQALGDHLATGATTMCHCWKLTPRSGGALGFTDHDRDIVFDGLTYESESGFTASEMEASLGFSVNNLDVSGALRSDRLSVALIEAGAFDGAAVEIWWVNWQDVSQRILTRKGFVGEIKRGSLGFTAEIRGLTSQFDEPRGRLFQFGCDAVLGDARCSVDLGNPAYSSAAAVNAVEDNVRMTVSGLSTFGDGWFSRGKLTWTSGVADGRQAEIKVHRLANGVAVLELWQAPSHIIQAGDGFVAKAGCDKQFSTCRNKFVNGANFRGFPHIPGDDFILTYPKPHDEQKSDED